MRDFGNGYLFTMLIRRYLFLYIHTLETKVYVPTILLTSDFER